MLLDAVDEFACGGRPQAWRAVRRAVAAAPSDGLVQVLGSRMLHLLGDHGAALAAAQAAGRLGVEAAVMQYFEQAREIGWHHEARSVLERILRAGPRGAAAPRRGDHREADPFDRAFAYLLQLYMDAQHYDAAAALLAAYLAQVRPSVSNYMQAARVFERRDESAAALDAVHRALAVETATATTRLEAAALLLRLGAFDEAQQLYSGLADDDSVGAQALEALARLCLWRGDSDGALAHAERLRERDSGSAVARRIEAAVNVLRGAYADALPLLDAVLRDAPNDAEAYAWRAEARLRLGHRDEAQVDAQRSPPGAGHSFAARALHVLAALPPAVSGGAASASSRSGAAPCGAAKTPAGLFAHTAQELGAELTAIDPQALHILTSGDEHAVAALLERALTAMRGNRTPRATWVRDDGSLARLPPSTSARVASRVLLELIKIASPEETLRHFDALLARLPHSSMPLVHRGELHLWLGRYAEARVDLEGAIAVQRQTRWAWYGLACLDLLAGEPQRALDTCAYGIQVMNNTEGPVAFSYRGEAYRLLGRLDEARAELQRACELHPRRLSAWVNLGLVHGAAGDRAAQRDVFRSLASSASGLLSAAADELGEEVFERVVLNGPQSGAESCPDGETIDRLFTHVLAMMRGNRSSSCITFFTCDGQLRHVPQGQRIDPQHTVRALSRIRRVLTK
jgi:tetratricopeptide (TPR) repeat protein